MKIFKFILVILFIALLGSCDSKKMIMIKRIRLNTKLEPLKFLCGQIVKIIIG